jgi:hypothetical protein
MAQCLISDRCNDILCKFVKTNMIAVKIIKHHIMANKINKMIYMIFSRNYI